MKTLPDDSKARQQFPIGSGCMAYFPAALAGVARHSYIGGAKYNDGGLVHLRYISTQHMDCVQRHLMDLQDLLAAKDRGATTAPTWVYNLHEKAEELIDLNIDEAILIECNALSWRSLAVSQELHEKLGKRPLAPAARTEPPSPPPVKVMILNFTEGYKVNIIRVIREFTGMGLKEAIDFVQSLPQSLEVKNNTYENVRNRLTEAGAILQ